MNFSEEVPDFPRGRRQSLATLEDEQPVKKGKGLVPEFPQPNLFPSFFFFFVFLFWGNLEQANASN